MRTCKFASVLSAVRTPTDKQTMTCEYVRTLEREVVVGWERRIRQVFHCYPSDPLKEKHGPQKKVAKLTLHQ